jgi:hypothetical protein
MEDLKELKEARLPFRSESLIRFALLSTLDLLIMIVLHINLKWIRKLRNIAFKLQSCSLVWVFTRLCAFAGCSLASLSFLADVKLRFFEGQIVLWLAAPWIHKKIHHSKLQRSALFLSLFLSFSLLSTNITIHTIAYNTIQYNEQRTQLVGTSGRAQ